MYKYLKRNDAALVFSPTKICLDDIFFKGESYEGSVRFQSNTLYYRSEVTAEYIHTVVAANDSFGQVKSGVKQIHPANNAERSALARGFLLEEVQAIYSEDTFVKKSESGYPVIIVNDKELDIAVSLSHDGGYVGYSICV